jgi:hypothetical protein
VAIANSELSTETKEFRFFEDHFLSINTDCEVFMNGRRGVFPFYYSFEENPIVINNLSQLTHELENLKSEKCYYLYQGYYSIQEDKADKVLGISRIYDTEKMISLLEENNFKRIFTYKIDDVDILLYEYNSR